ncbi:MAG: protein kinase [Myxococcaceae bacterium]|nr:protein kinase [Myxococcaceae bacterium]
METPRAAALNPAHLPPGTRVGDWLVVAWAGRGVHGAVYQAVPVDDPLAPPVALKIALLPRDPRLAREVALLSCVRHPSVPRLWDHGEWLHPSGSPYPFLVMDWIEGAPLYDQARQSPPSSQRVLGWMAQLARALQALHSQGCVHRDVKGDNVRVRHSDGRAVLTDFGSGRYPEAATLTPDILPPGTPAYRSPEAWLFSLQFFRAPKARYCAQPADDLYALGVTAYRLVTSQYPELGEPSQDEADTWHLEGLASPAPLDLNPRVSPRLDALILRMLSLRPEERGTAAELAEALEQAAQLTTPESTRPLFTQELRPEESTVRQRVAASEPASLPPGHEETQAQAQAAVVPSGEQCSSPRVSPPARARSWRGRLLKAAALMALGAWVWWCIPRKFPEQPTAVRHEAVEARLEDGGTSGLGDEAATASTQSSPAPSVPGVRADDTLPEPLPGQARLDAKGRCPRVWQVALGGGCWVKTSLDREKCESLKPIGGHMFKGTCYMPVLLHGRQPTSDPARKP